MFHYYIPAMRPCRTSEALAALRANACPPVLGMQGNAVHPQGVMRPDAHHKDPVGVYCLYMDGLAPSDPSMDRGGLMFSHI